jgi:hypothetical protein
MMSTKNNLPMIETSRRSGQPATDATPALRATALRPGRQAEGGLLECRQEFVLKGGSWLASKLPPLSLGRQEEPSIVGDLIWT